MCDHFSRLWKRTNRPFDELLRLHVPERSYGVEDSTAPEFVRLDKYQRAQPKPHPVKPCKCGLSADRWKCWHRTASMELLGEARINWDR